MFAKLSVAHLCTCYGKNEQSPIGEVSESGKRLRFRVEGFCKSSRT